MLILAVGFWARARSRPDQLLPAHLRHSGASHCDSGCRWSGNRSSGEKTRRAAAAALSLAGFVTSFTHPVRPRKMAINVGQVGMIGVVRQMRTLAPSLHLSLRGNLSGSAFTVSPTLPPRRSARCRTNRGFRMVARKLSDVTPLQTDSHPARANRASTASRIV